jgi:hypothetical protein
MDRYCDAKARMDFGVTPSVRRLRRITSILQLSLSFCEVPPSSKVLLELRSLCCSVPRRLIDVTPSATNDSPSSVNAPSPSKLLHFTSDLDSQAIATEAPQPKMYITHHPAPSPNPPRSRLHSPSSRHSFQPPVNPLTENAFPSLRPPHHRRARALCVGGPDCARRESRLASSQPFWATEPL